VRRSGSRGQRGGATPRDGCTGPAGRERGREQGRDAREKKSLTGGDRWSEGGRRKGRRVLAEKERGADTRAQVAVRGREGKERAGCWVSGEVGWGAAHAGREEGRVLGLGWPMRERGGEKEAGLGQGVLDCSFLFHFFSLFYTH
jgi:hypothetical protein